MAGPLKGLKVVEIAGIGPGPFCAMLLADMGADVVRVDRAARFSVMNDKFDFLNRGKRSISIDLKKPDGVEAVLKLVEKADIILEGFRPGVMERLGLGPDVCLGRNPRIAYGRMTGFGQDGPMAKAAGHDINYIAMSGALHMIGHKGGRPVPPINFVGDFGGGSMFLAFGLLAAVIEARSSGKGQVVDATMIDGAALLTTMMYGMKAQGLWQDERGVNLLDTGAHFYDTYETKDGKYVSIGSIEPQFYAELIRLAGLDPADFGAQMDVASWPAMKEKLAAVIRGKTRAEWDALMEGTDVCYAPVLSMEEAPKHPHNIARGVFFEQDGHVQPAPAPRFSRTRPDLPAAPPLPGQDTETALADWGFSAAEIARLKEAGAAS
ncbi:CaiB/BaiF CoA transferase family protein [Zavarzinia compransoris]|uniref:Carnitine dehydratase n=1 Tax=Zavarzinia compransoris TaxID=1264899 RepID=A0A317EBJ3_9PROT|nr:CaiB/BaiF CoA-transferase family protein [Zavarzinia compransoris]PWR23606.1 carnitine dehydratase [Zavarzinia compransoris]TDP47823.1 alpha-methylacyl-CoA racemase [Zavarzinia compransoris]